MQIKTIAIIYKTFYMTKPLFDHKKKKCTSFTTMNVINHINKGHFEITAEEYTSTMKANKSNIQ